LIVLFEFPRDFTLFIQHGHDPAEMGGYADNLADYSVPQNDPHMVFNPLVAPFVDHQEIIAFIGGVADYFSADIPVLKPEESIPAKVRIDIGFIIGIRQA
jgi:hypothetical protein